MTSPIQRLAAPHRIARTIAATALAAALLPAAYAHAQFGMAAVSGALTEPGGGAVTQAGAHPDFTTTIALATEPVGGGIGPSGNVKDVHVALPPGLIGNPQGFAHCTASQLRGASGFAAECAVDSQVGVVEITNCFSGSCASTPEPIYNMQAPAGVPAQFGFNVDSALVYINARVAKVDSGGGYAVVTDTDGISQTLALAGIRVTLWGVPADPAHDVQRFHTSGELFGQTGATSGAPEIPLMRSPTSCGSPLTFAVTADSWTGLSSAASFASEEGTSDPLRSEGCGQTPFEPSLRVQPTSTQAGAPTGLEVDLSVAQNENPHGLASADLRKAQIALPAGMVVNPAAAAGLGSCGEAEAALLSEAPSSCPDSSKLGEVEIHTPLLAEPLTGAVYLARQGENPFSSTLALYLVASGSGVTVKLPGLIAPDATTGRVLATFSETPQLPFSELTLRLKGGTYAPLSNPSTCGAQTATAELESWGGASVPATSSFAITGACPSGTFAPGFDAGSTVASAGSQTGFTLSVTRNDGEQTLGSVATELPPGLLGFIKRVPLCGEPAASQGMCDEASLIGHTTVAVGAGAAPFYLSGRVYLTSGYAGAPYGLSIVVPALAGPLNLGLVVVRAAVRVSPTDAHVSVVSDPLPSILQGIPLQLRSVNVTIDRPGFLFNPTSCASRSVRATIGGGAGASASVAAPFQATNCSALAFRPTLSASSSAHTSKANGASLHVHVSSAAGEANIARVLVALPKQLPSRLSTLQKACLAATFDANPAACPAASLVGSGRALTPILARALSGSAYLVSHGSAAFPDLEVVLQGEGITIVLDGKTHIRHGITTSEFNTVPDAPITAFDLVLPSGPHSVFAAFGRLCRGTLRMPTTIVGQDGAVLQPATRIAVAGCPRSHIRASRRSH